MEAACILYNYSNLEEEEEEGIGGKEKDTLLTWTFIRTGEGLPAIYPPRIILCLSTLLSACM
jgi:hypothetical protein